jgi:hypothetical protein
VINEGLIKTIPFGAGNIWVVRGNHFMFSTVTAIPTTKVTIAPSAEFTPEAGCKAKDYFVCLRPMKATLSSSVYSITLIDDGTGLPFDLAGRFDFDLACKSVEAAKFGKPLPPDSNPEPNELLLNRLMGIENVRPKAPVLTPTGSGLLKIDVATAFRYETVDDEPPFDPYHLPLRPDAKPSGPVPHVDPQAISKIRDTLMNPDVVRVRDQVFAIVNVFGINPITNGSLATYAANPATVLAGDPLITDGATA